MDLTVKHKIIKLLETITREKSLRPTLDKEFLDLTLKAEYF